MVSSDDTCRCPFLDFFFCFSTSFSALLSSIIGVALGGGDSLVRLIMLIFCVASLEHDSYLGRVW
jgi:hypothetical protein